MFRRVWYLDDYISEDNAYTLPGTEQWWSSTSNQKL